MNTGQRSSKDNALGNRHFWMGTNENLLWHILVVRQYSFVLLGALVPNGIAGEVQRVFFA